MLSRSGSQQLPDRCRNEGHRPSQTNTNIRIWGHPGPRRRNRPRRRLRRVVKQMKPSNPEGNRRLKIARPSHATHITPDYKEGFFFFFLLGTLDSLTNDTYHNERYLREFRPDNLVGSFSSLQVLIYVYRNLVGVTKNFMLWKRNN